MKKYLGVLACGILTLTCVVGGANDKANRLDDPVEKDDQKVDSKQAKDVSFDNLVGVGRAALLVKPFDRPNDTWSFHPFKTDTDPRYVDWLDELNAFLPVVDETGADKTLVFKVAADKVTDKVAIIIEGNLKTNKSGNGKSKGKKTKTDPELGHWALNIVDPIVCQHTKSSYRATCGRPIMFILLCYWWLQAIMACMISDMIIMTIGRTSTKPPARK